MFFHYLTYLTGDLQMPDMLSMTDLTMAGLKLSQLPAGMEEQRSIVNIDLSRNKLFDSAFAVKWSSVTKLTLSDNQIIGSFGMCY